MVVHFSKDMGVTSWHDSVWFGQIKTTFGALILGLPTTQITNRITNKWMTKFKTSKHTNRQINKLLKHYDICCPYDLNGSIRIITIPLDKILDPILWI